MQKKLLHVGCGQSSLPDLKGFTATGWQEIRYDIDSDANPDILGTIADMSMVASLSMDAVYSSHNIEHLYPHEVPKALGEFYRVLNNEGFAVISCPDLVSVSEVVAKDKLFEPLYNSAIGPIAAIDILYGHRGHLKQGKSYMAHKCGFTLNSLGAALSQAGFKYFWGGSRPSHYDLWIVAFKEQKSQDELQRIALSYLP